MLVKFLPLFAVRYLNPEARVLLSELNQHMAPQFAKLNKALAELVCFNGGSCLREISESLLLFFVFLSVFVLRVRSQVSNFHYNRLLTALLIRSTRAQACIYCICMYVEIVWVCCVTCTES